MGTRFSLADGELGQAHRVVLGDRPRSPSAPRSAAAQGAFRAGTRRCPGPAPAGRAPVPCVSAFPVCRGGTRSFPAGPWLPVSGPSGTADEPRASVRLSVCCGDLGWSQGAQRCRPRGAEPDSQAQEQEGRRQHRPRVPARRRRPRARPPSSTPCSLQAGRGPPRQEGPLTQEDLAHPRSPWG